MQAPTTQESLSSEDSGRIRLSLTFKGGKLVFSETENTAPHVLAFQLRTKTLTVDPLGGGVNHPYLVTVEFEASGFTFEKPAENAVIWKKPTTRPPFVGKPELEDDDKLLRLFAVNASSERQTVHFELIPAGAIAAAIGPIDPTIVNNPDPPR